LRSGGAAGESEGEADGARAAEGRGPEAPGVDSASGVWQRGHVPLARERYLRLQLEQVTGDPSTMGARIHNRGAYDECQSGRCRFFEGAGQARRTVTVTATPRQRRRPHGDDGDPTATTATPRRRRRPHGDDGDPTATTATPRQRRRRRAPGRVAGSSCESRAVRANRGQLVRIAGLVVTGRSWTGRSRRTSL